MQSTMFVTELEALHMSTKLSAFQNCNKEGLVRTLWRNHSQEPRVRHCHLRKWCRSPMLTLSILWTFCKVYYVVLQSYVYPHTIKLIIVVFVCGGDGWLGVWVDGQPATHTPG